LGSCWRWFLCPARQFEADWPEIILKKIPHLEFYIFLTETWCNGNWKRVVEEIIRLGNWCCGRIHEFTVCEWVIELLGMRVRSLKGNRWRKKRIKQFWWFDWESESVLMYGVRREGFFFFQLHQQGKKLHKSTKRQFANDGGLIRIVIWRSLQKVRGCTNSYRELRHFKEWKSRQQIGWLW
jgi:hypothetical protein